MVLAGDRPFYLPIYYMEPPHFGDVEERVREFLQERVRTAGGGPAWGRGGGIRHLR